METEPADGRVISDGGLVEPGRNEALGIYDGTFALVVDGWAQSAGPDPVTVEIGCEDEVLWRGTPGQISTGWGAAPPRGARLPGRDRFSGPAAPSSASRSRR